MRASQARTARSPGGDHPRTAATRVDDDTATELDGADLTSRTRPLRTRATERGGPPAPMVLERYRLERRLGAGAFGTVWRARDERLERPVAVKILPRERVVGGRFEREARVAARLAHPGIVTLYEASVDDEGAYLVSELVRGSTLDDLLAQGLLSDRDIVAIGIALCDALAHAHEEGVIHRDVKPSNVLIPQKPATAAQVAKLTDFGVARVIGGDTLTMTGDVIGTLAYMAPEQAEGLEAGAPADLYALALVLYEALTGVNPVLVTPAARRGRRLGVHLPPLRRQRRDLPRALGAGLDAALRPHPGERGRLRDLRAALVEALDEVSDEPGIVGGPGVAGLDPATLTGWGHDSGGHPSDENPEQLDRARHRLARSPDPVAEAEGDLEAAPAPAWPARGLGALGAAATVAWLAAHLLAPPPVAPAAAGLIAAALCLLLPRIGWMTLVTALAAYAAAQSHAGLALPVTIALLVPTLALLVRATAWPLPAGAVALALVPAAGLAGAWPALAGLAGTVWRRAALGALGWVWLLLAAPLAGRGLYLALPHATAAVAAWQGSIPAAADHVIRPLAVAGAFAPAAVWALAAAVLPWIVRGRSLVLDLVRAVVWAATMTAATPAVIAASRGAHAAPSIRGAALGGAAAAIIALLPRWLAAHRPALSVVRRASGAGPRFP